MLVVQHIGDLHRVDTPAKINVGLRLLGKRPDGFHDIESLVMAIDLVDTLDASATADGVITLKVVPDGADAPADESNLALRAARLLQEAGGVEQGAELTLTKRIPAGRGLGGGSSDAAAALVLLSTLWGLDWPAERLAALAAELGSDVPFFLHSPLAIMKGRGEIIEPVDGAADVAVLLVVPPEGLSTREVYLRANAPLTRPEEGDSLRWLHHLQHAQIDVLGTQLANDLEPAAQALYECLKRIRSALERAGAACVLMTGSGSAMFALTADREAATLLADRLEVEPGVTTHVVVPWHRPIALGKR